MPELDMGAYLADTLPDHTAVMKGIPSVKHPKGKSYTLGRVSALDQVRLERLLDLQMSGAEFSESDLAYLQPLITDADGKPVDFRIKLMGSAYQEMLDDGVDSEAMKIILSMVFTYHGAGSEIAQRVIAKSGEASAASGNRATRRAAKKTTTTLQKKAGSSTSPASTPTRARSPRKQAPTRAAGRSTTSPNAPVKQPAKKTA